MKTSPRGIEDLVLSEGLSLKAYKDSVGVWTIGVGHAATSGKPPIPRPGMTITEAEAKRILAADLAEREATVSAVLGDVPQHVFDGAMSFHFNTGAIQRASWVRAFKRGDRAEAERLFMLYNKPPEIVGRRKREADLIFRGKYRSGPVAPPAPAPPPSGDPILRKGDGINVADPRRRAVAEAQMLLDDHGFSPGAIDGKFGLVTEAKVIAFQKASGLEPDGVIGPATWAALRASPAKRATAAPARQPDDPGPNMTTPQPAKETAMMETLKGKKTYIALALGGAVVILNALGVEIPGVDLDQNGWLQQVLMLLAAGGFRSAMNKG